MIVIAEGFVVVAAILAAIELIRSKAESLIAWAVLLLAVGILISPGWILKG